MKLILIYGLNQKNKDKLVRNLQNGSLNTLVIDQKVMILRLKMKMMVMMTNNKVKIVIIKAKEINITNNKMMMMANLTLYKINNKCNSENLDGKNIMLTLKNIKRKPNILNFPF